MCLKLFFFGGAGDAVFLWVSGEAASYLRVSLCCSHRVEVVEEAHAVRRRGRLHGELQEGLHVQMGLDHSGGPQESRHGCPGSVYASCAHTKRNP